MHLFASGIDAGLTRRVVNFLRRQEELQYTFSPPFQSSSVYLSYTRQLHINSFTVILRHQRARGGGIDLHIFPGTKGWFSTVQATRRLRHTRDS